MLNNRLIFSDVEQFKTNMTLFGEMEGIDKAITEDATTKAITLAGKYSELQRKRINTRWKLNTELTIKKIRDSFFKLIAKRIKPTYKAISLESGIPFRTIERSTKYRDAIRELKQ